MGNQGLAWLGAAGALVVGAAAVATDLTPAPVVGLIKVGFDRAGRALALRMQAWVPDGVTRRLDVPYREGDAVALLDVFAPADAVGPLPAVVWVHGGGWVAGSKEHVAPYLQVLAAGDGGPGYVTVGLDYTLAGDGRYPLPLQQIDAALSYLLAHAGELDIDPDRIVLAGDSAGAQLASHYAAMVTDRAFADEVGIDPVVTPEQLRGVLLHCGVYDLTVFEHAPAPVNWAFDKVLWAYTGSRLRDSAAMRQMSSLNAVTPHFPPALVSGGNGDPFTSNQSKPLVERLQALGVPVTAHFFPADTVPVLPHEFQFDLDLEAARVVLADTHTFLRERFEVTVPA